MSEPCYICKDDPKFRSFCSRCAGTGLHSPIPPTSNERLTDDELAKIVTAASAFDHTRPWLHIFTALKELQERRVEVEKYKAWAASCDETTTAHERELDEVMKERDHAQDVLQDVHTVLGGDGEWKGRLPPQEPPDSGDLHLDVPALARERMAELATWQESCTGKHGSQQRCIDAVPAVKTTERLEPK